MSSYFSGFLFYFNLFPLSLSFFLSFQVSVTHLKQPSKLNGRIYLKDDKQLAWVILFPFFVLCMCVLCVYVCLFCVYTILYFFFRLVLKYLEFHLGRQIKMKWLKYWDIVNYKDAKWFFCFVFQLPIYFIDGRKTMKWNILKIPTHILFLIPSVIKKHRDLFVIDLWIETLPPMPYR